MESEDADPDEQLAELDAARAAARLASFPTSPWWYFAAIGAVGPTLILIVRGVGPWRGIGVVALAGIVVGLLAHDRGRRTLRPRPQMRSGRQQWLFTAMIFSVIIIGQLIQRAGGQANAWLMAAISFVALSITSWWFARRIERDADQDPLGGTT